MNAYDSSYVPCAQRVLGRMFDFGINDLGFCADEMAGLFVGSGVARCFAAGQARFVAGMSGLELAREVLELSGLGERWRPAVIPLDRSPEYWAGWALAYYQWQSSRTFEAILGVVSMWQIVGLYPVYHEMDILQFCDFMERACREFCGRRAPLARLRCRSGMSQRDLARASGVPVRTIQQYEQRQKDLARAQVSTVRMLSRALSCEMTDLLE